MPQFTPAPPKSARIPQGAQIASAIVSRSRGRSGASLPTDAPSMVTVTRKQTPVQTTLHFVGVLDASTVHQMRDAAFTEVGPRPKRLCLDLTGAGVPDINAINALVTIANVARMVDVPFCVRVSAPFGEILETTLLSRIVPVETVETAAGETEAGETGAALETPCR